MPKSGRAATVRSSPAPARTHTELVRLPTYALTVAFVASGAAGLIFELVWFYRASLALGNTIWASSIVLSSFMAGLGLGNLLVGWRSRRIRRPLQLYATLEIVVGVSGLAATYALPEFGRLLVQFAPAAMSMPRLLTAARLALAFGVLAVPAVAMGATLPALIAALQRSEAHVGPDFGRLYGWNTLGAVGGVLCAELILIAKVGVISAAWSAMLLNMAAALIALTLVARRAPSRPDTDRRLSAAAGVVTPASIRWLLCAAASGGALTALEVIWFRFLSMFVLTTTLPMSLMLAVVLGGIGIGGLAAAALIRRRGAVPAAVAAVAFLAACAVPASYRLFGAVTSGSQIGNWREVLWFAVVMTGPTSCLSGVLLTFLAESLSMEIVQGAAAAAWLLLANTIGATLGPIIAAFVLLPELGMERAIFIIAAVYVGIGSVAASALGLFSTRRRPSWLVPIAAAAALAILVTFPFGLMDRYQDRVIAPYKADGSQVVARREGPAESILLMREQWLNHTIYDRLVTNGYSMTGTATSARRYMRYFAYWPMLLHAAPLKTALLICYGVGVTAGALADIPSLEKIDVVETSPDIASMSDLIYSPANHPLRDPRVRLRFDDGRFFLQTTGQRYDLITGEPPPPRTPGAVNIYTREYFQLVYDRLAQGGMATYWLPVARPDPGTDVNTIVRAFCDVFADCSLWNATPSDFMLVGTRDANGPVGIENFVDAWRVPRLRASLRDIGFETPEQIGATFLGDAAYLRALVRDTPPLTDDFPQRLRPVSGRPSLSDPRYNTDPAVMKLFEAVIDPRRARDQFANSALIRRLWPRELAAATLPFFEYQRIVNRILWEGGQPLRQIEDLHSILTKTALETIPLWLLGTDDVVRGIAETAAASNPNAEYIRGLSALARREYTEAVVRLDHAAALGVRVPTVRPLTVYALCLDGRLEAARQRAVGVTPTTAEEQHFWTFIGSQFAVGPFAHVERH